MSIGTFGKRIFTVSDTMVLTFRDFTYQTAARYTVHDTLLAKPRAEYIGPGLDVVTFSICLRAELGVNVQKEIDAWRKMAHQGSAERLIIGKKKQGSARWVITDCSEAWGLVTNRGMMLSALLNITLQEYV